MQTLIWILVGLVVIAILWRITKFVAKLAIVALAAWLLYQFLFVGISEESPIVISPIEVLEEGQQQVTI